MKTFFTSLAFVVISLVSSAATITAVTSTLSPGNWTVGSTWSSGTVPANGDLVIIPLGKGVEVGSQVYSATIPTLSIEVSGTLNFKPSGKLDLALNSYLQLFLGAKIIPQNSSSSQLVTIGGVTKYNAANNGILLGPAYANKISGVSQAGIPLSGFDMGVLPVKLVSFYAKQSNGQITIQWQTAEELNADFFEVEKSTNDGRSWTVLNKIIAQGSPSDYSINTIRQTNTKILYRLKMVDKNGSAAYSSIVRIDQKNVINLSVSPNPSNGRFNISVPEPLSRNGSIHLINFAGQTIKKMNIEVGRNNYDLNFQDLPKGAYMISFFDGDLALAKQTILIQ